MPDITVKQLLDAREKTETDALVFLDDLLRRFTQKTGARVVSIAIAFSSTETIDGGTVTTVDDVTIEVKI